MRVVISQPMFFPWVGMLEQIRLADAFVHYDDVQFSKGSFTNRVQVKTPRGSEWLTLPLRNLHLGMRINEVRIDERSDWRKRHLDTLEQALGDAPFASDALQLACSVYSERSDRLVDFLLKGFDALVDYFDIRPKRVERSSTLGIGGKSSERVLALVRELGGDVYITGHGARAYLDHDYFETRGVSVEYVSYNMVPYAQQWGDFTPFVSSLDLVANTGRCGREKICSGTIPWKEFVSK